MVFGDRRDEWLPQSIANPSRQKHVLPDFSMFYSFVILLRLLPWQYKNIVKYKTNSTKNLKMSMAIGCYLVVWSVELSSSIWTPFEPPSFSAHIVSLLASSGASPKPRLRNGHDRSNNSGGIYHLNSWRSESIKIIKPTHRVEHGWETTKRSKRKSGRNGHHHPWLSLPQLLWLSEKAICVPWISSIISWKILKKT